MQTAPFLVGRYIHWQGEVFYIIVYQAEGLIRLEEWPTKAPCTVELATLQHALSQGELLIGVVLEQETAESIERFTKTVSQEEAQDSLRGTVITYQPIYNVESFFTTCPPSSKQQHLPRRRRLHPNMMPKRGLKRERHTLSFHHRSNQSSLQNERIFPGCSSAGEGAKTRYKDPMESETKLSVWEAMNRDFQAPGPITIRWLNLLKSDLLLSPLSVTPSLKKIRGPLAPDKIGGTHPVAEIEVIDPQSAEMPISTILTDEKSGLAVGWYLVLTRLISES
ncbi:MAG TPA: hypothetical protein VH593_01030 [Ktedonobacteraceae bacterium]|jgi:hypothetical protein